MRDKPAPMAMQPVPTQQGLSSVQTQVGRMAESGQMPASVRWPQLFWEIASVLVATRSALGYCGYMENDTAIQALQVLKDQVEVMTERAEAADAGPPFDDLVEINAELRRTVSALKKERDELQITVDAMLDALHELEAA